MEDSAPFSTGETVFVLALYFLPWLVAKARGHHQSGAIFATVTLLGWTVVGWIFAMIWAYTAIPPEYRRR